MPKVQIVAAVLRQHKGRRRPQCPALQGGHDGPTSCYPATNNVTPSSEEASMSHRSGCVLLTVFLALARSQAGQAQSLDLLIRGGRVIDPRNGIDGVRDVGIADGRIAEVAVGIDPARAETVVDATGLVVAPGLVDLHTHVFFGTQPNSAYSDGYSAIPPDGFTFRTGVTTIVDLGGAGWRDFIQFKEQVIDRSQTRVLVFLNIVGSGMKGGPIE